MRIPICEGCGEIVPLDRGGDVRVWSGRRRCNDCPTAAADRADAWIEDVEWLLDSGAGWGEICRRMDSTRTAISRRLWRHHRADLAVVFEREVAA